MMAHDQISAESGCSCFACSIFITANKIIYMRVGLARYNFISLNPGKIISPTVKITYLIYFEENVNVDFSSYIDRALSDR